VIIKNTDKEIESLFCSGFFTLDGVVYKNKPTIEGRNYAINAAIRGATQTSTWYCGLISSERFKRRAVTDTASEHGGWIESTAYTQANRVTWSPDAAEDGKAQNSTAMVFTFNADTEISGFFISSSNTKGGTSGIIFSTAGIGSSLKYANGANATVTYTV